MKIRQLIGSLLAVWS